MIAAYYNTGYTDIVLGNLYHVYSDATYLQPSLRLHLKLRKTRHIVRTDVSSSKENSDTIHQTTIKQIQHT